MVSELVQPRDHCSHYITLHWLLHLNNKHHVINIVIIKFCFVILFGSEGGSGWLL